jgi:hypothetical protein
MAANITKGQKNWLDNFNDLNKELKIILMMAGYLQALLTKMVLMVS